MADNGCHGVTLFGIAGEYYKLTDAESERMVRVVVDTCKKKGIPSIISVTQHATEVAAKRAKYYQDCGADSLMLLPPYFLKPGAGAIYEHMKTVCNAVDHSRGGAVCPGADRRSPSPPEVMANLRKRLQNGAVLQDRVQAAGGYISNR